MKIIKSIRKTLSMSFDRNGTLIIKVPYFTRDKTIKSFIEKHEDWIRKRKDFFLNKIKKLDYGEKFFFFGKQYELKQINNGKKLYFDGNYFYLDISYKNKIKELLEVFYKKEARKYIENRLKEIKELYGLEYNKFRITSAKTRWGSCSSKKNINFSYRLIMAPVETIDYVIVHELAHLKHMNHSKIFHLEVDDMMKGLSLGDYKIYKDWLKKYGNNLIF